MFTLWLYYLSVLFFLPFQELISPLLLRFSFSLLRFSLSLFPNFFFCHCRGRTGFAEMPKQGQIHPRIMDAFSPRVRLLGLYVFPSLSSLLTTATSRPGLFAISLRGFGSVVLQLPVIILSLLCASLIALIHHQHDTSIMVYYRPQLSA